MKKLISLVIMACMILSAQVLTFAATTEQKAFEFATLEKAVNNLTSEFKAKEIYVTRLTAINNQLIRLNREIGEGKKYKNESDLKAVLNNLGSVVPKINLKASDLSVYAKKGDAKKLDTTAITDTQKKIENTVKNLNKALSSFGIKSPTTPQTQTAQVQTTAWKLPQSAEHLRKPAVVDWTPTKEQWAVAEKWVKEVQETYKNPPPPSKMELLKDKVYRYLKAGKTVQEWVADLKESERLPFSPPEAYYTKEFAHPIEKRFQLWWGGVDAYNGMSYKADYTFEELVAKYGDWAYTLHEVYPNHWIRFGKPWR